MKVSEFIRKIRTYFRKPQRGVAFIIVMVMIAILLPIVTDMNYEAKTEFNLAMNYKRKAEAQALASSAVNFAVVVFDLQDQIESILKQFNMNQSIEIWDIIPFDTAILRGFVTAGPFVEVEDIVNAKETEVPTGSAQNEEEGDYTFTETGDPIFQFPGDFKIDFQSEDTKINLNNLAYGTKTAVIKMLQGIIESEFYDFIFLEDTSRPEYVDRTELIQNIIDWVDSGDEKYTDSTTFTTGGDEQAQYNEFIPRYKVKNAKFDTISELMMVYGVNDLIFKIFEPYVTIYSTGKINITKASSDMVEAIIRAYAVDKNSAVFYNEDAMRELLGKVLAARAKDGFANAAAFVQAVKDEGVELESGVTNIIDVTSSVFRIRATGIKEGVESWVEMVVDKEGNIYYYREG